MNFNFIVTMFFTFSLLIVFSCDSDDWEEVGKPKLNCADDQYDEKEACIHFLQAEDLYVNQPCKMMSVNPEAFCKMRWHCIADVPACYDKTAIKQCVDSFPTTVCSDAWQDIYPESCRSILEAAPGCTVGESTFFER